METAQGLLHLVTIGLVVVGFLLEVIGAAALGLYPLRRMIRVSPLSLLSTGGACLVLGLVLFAFG